MGDNLVPALLNFDLMLAIDFATTIAAADGTSSALDYVTSGVGGAIKGVIGVNPWSPAKVSGCETFIVTLLLTGIITDRRGIRDAKT